MENEFSKCYSCTAKKIRGFQMCLHLFLEEIKSKEEETKYEVIVREQNLQGSKNFSLESFKMATIFSMEKIYSHYKRMTI